MTRGEVLVRANCLLASRSSPFPVVYRLFNEAFVVIGDKLLGNEKATLAGLPQ